MNRGIGISLGILGAVALLGLSACQNSDQRPLAATAPHELTKSVRPNGGYFPSDVPSPRRSRSFANMTAAQLEQMIQAGGGRVLIGFKDSGATDGVDAYGRVLASSATTASMKASLRAQGVRIQYEFKNLPAVAAVLPPGIVRTLLVRPNIDYVEPGWDSQHH